MPVLILILKMGIITSYITTTQISFTDDRIFPSSKRNTSVGTCGMIARSVTIVAPIVNEWDTPYPILCLLIFSVMGIVVSLTFQTEQLPSTTYKALNHSNSEISYRDLSKEIIEEDVDSRHSEKDTHFKTY